MIHISSFPVGVGDLASQRQTGLTEFVTPIGGDTPLEAKPQDLTESSPIRQRRNPASSSLWPVSIRKNSPHKEKPSAHITVCKKCVASEQSETRNLLKPCVEIASCLNWIDECIVKQQLFFLFVCLFFFLFIYVIELLSVCLKGKLSTSKKYAAFQSIVCQCHHDDGALHPDRSLASPGWMRGKYLGTCEIEINLLASLEWWLKSIISF